MFYKTIHSRIKIVGFLIIMMFILVIIKVFYIQVISYGKLNSLASSLWNRNLQVWMTHEPGSTFKNILTL